MTRQEHPMMKKFLRLIRDDKLEEYADLLDELKDIFVTKRLNKVILSFKWVEKLPLYCTLCGRHKMLQQIRTKLLAVHTFQCYASFGLEVHVIDLAKALHYPECQQELDQLYPGPHDKHHTCQDHGPQDYQLFEGVLKTAKSCIDELGPIICSVLCRLCENGYNIRAQGRNGNTTLHAAIVQSASFDIIRTLVTLGCDMNTPDSVGGSSLMGLCLRKNFYRNDRNVMMKLLKLWLYHNPDISIHQNIVRDIVLCDRIYHKNPDVVSLQTNQSDDAYHSSPDVETFISQSDDELYLLPWLYIGGFHITTEDIECDSENHVTYMLDLNIPRDLKQLARSRIRCTYPGLTLHTTIKQSPLPASIRDYILMEELNVS